MRSCKGQAAAALLSLELYGVGKLTFGEKKRYGAKGKAA